MVEIVIRQLVEDADNGKMDSKSHRRSTDLDRLASNLHKLLLDTKFLKASLSDSTKQRTEVAK